MPSLQSWLSFQVQLHGYLQGTLPVGQPNTLAQFRALGPEEVAHCCTIRGVTREDVRSLVANENCEFVLVTIKQVQQACKQARTSIPRRG